MGELFLMRTAETALSGPGSPDEQGLPHVAGLSVGRRLKSNYSSSVCVIR